MLDTIRTICDQKNIQAPSMAFHRGLLRSISCQALIDASPYADPLLGYIETPPACSAKLESSMPAYLFSQPRTSLCQTSEFSGLSTHCGPRISRTQAAGGRRKDARGSRRGRLKTGLARRGSAGR